MRPLDQAESPIVRRVLALAAFGFAALFLIHASAYWAPAHPGVDQNGYLVGGKLFSETLTMQFFPIRPGTRDTVDPFQHVGNMWVGTDYGTPNESYYPKYPLGLPLLVASSLWIGGLKTGPVIAYWINPVAMTLTMIATYLFARRIIGSVYALLATAVFATSPVTIGLTTNPNSHATAVCCTAWGMLMLLRWWEARGAWRAIAAGLLLGFSATIRYSEGSLIVAILWVIGLAIWAHRRNLRTWREGGWMVFCWVIPIASLLLYNCLAIGAWTGYGPTNESTGFRLEYAADNWETLLRQLNTNGLAFLLPFGVLGMIWICRQSWKIGGLLLLWIVPCMLIYTFYYWAPDNQQAQVANISYLRFFLTILPALAIVSFWTIRQIAVRFAWPATLAAGVLAGAVVIAQLRNALPALEGDQFNRLALQAASEQVLSTAPAGSVIFVSDQGLGTPLLQHLQFAGDYTLYGGQSFNRNWIQRLPEGEQADQPQGLDPNRREALYRRLKDFTQAQLDDEQRKIITGSLGDNRRVFVLLPRRANDPPARRRRPERPQGRNRLTVVLDPAIARVLVPDKFDTEVVAAWNMINPRPAETSPGRRNVRGGFRPAMDRRMVQGFQLVEVTPKL